MAAARYSSFALEVQIYGPAYRSHTGSHVFLLTRQPGILWAEGEALSGFSPCVFRVIYTTSKRQGARKTARTPQGRRSLWHSRPVGTVERSEWPGKSWQGRQGFRLLLLHDKDECPCASAIRRSDRTIPISPQSSTPGIPPAPLRAQARMRTSMGAW